MLLSRMPLPGVPMYIFKLWVLLSLVIAFLLIPPFFYQSLTKERIILSADRAALQNGRGLNMNYPKRALRAAMRIDKYVEVPQMVWGLNNQKIGLARAALTARKLNRTLVMPKLSASLFNTKDETQNLDPIDFDQIFSFESFNFLCDGFVRIAAPWELPGQISSFTVVKGSGRRWTAEKDMNQLEECSKPYIDEHSLIKIKGENPFLWRDHWPVKDYARVLKCLVLVDRLSSAASRIVSKLRQASSRIISKDFAEVDQASHSGTRHVSFKSPYIAVHMRIEKDWIIHCKKLETRARNKYGKELHICSSKEEIIDRVEKLPGLRRFNVVFLAAADDLLENNTLVDGWSSNMIPYEKKTLGVMELYRKYPYLIQSAIDYQVCLEADIFVGNSFSTFSSLVVLERTMRFMRGRPVVDCGHSYAYNIVSDGRAVKWATNMSGLNFEAISYGSNKVSCIL